MLSDEEFRQLLNHLERPWAGFRKVRKGVKKRVRRHMQMLGCQTVVCYLDRIDHDTQVRAECENCLRVTISRFFRDRRLWDHLQSRVLPALMGRFPHGLSAWSAGCAGGEEPYTLALIWEEMAAAYMQMPSLHILATDADASGLKRAETGCYPPSSLKEVPQDLKIRRFRQVRGGRQWKIKPGLSAQIEWRVQQLMDPPPPQTFQLILLRNNLLTYYQGQMLIAAIDSILGTLERGGVLVVGSHERLPSLSFPLARDSACPWVYLYS